MAPSRPGVAPASIPGVEACAPSVRSDNRVARLHRPLLLSGLVASLAIRLYALGVESLWYDESVSVSLAQRTIPELIAHTAGDIHPPGYYLLLNLWRALAQPRLGHGLEFVYAWPSVAASVVTLALLFVIGRRLCGPRAALAALWLGAFSPYAIWYAQEVRMYALAGALGLLCLWATLRWTQEGARTWLVVLALSAAVGLYVLYYFAFVLAGLAVAAAILAPGWRRYGTWWLGLIGAAILYVPWTGTLWRQMTDPPVPPWRVAWSTVSEAAAAVAEAVAAPLSGQTLAGAVWLWAAVSAGLSILFLLVAPAPRRVRWGLLAFVWLGPLLMVLLTATVTPLYHVRYLYATSVLFPLIAAGALVGVAVRGRAGRPAGAGEGSTSGWAVWVAGAGLAALLTLEVAALYDFWSNPNYRADDHRGAVASLAAGWRPGDVVLANAGWITPIFDVYWPRPNPSGAPPPLAEPLRINDLVASEAITLSMGGGKVPLVRTGSVDGDPSLGWGDPQSDFFASSSDESRAGLEQVRQRSHRVWHYRLYDTVSDPHGVIREWLETNTELQRDEAIPGRDLGRLELRSFTEQRPTPTAAPLSDFGDALQLVAMETPAAVRAGETLYAQTVWRALPGIAHLPAALSVSVRLYDSAGEQALQADGGALPPTTEWEGLSTRNWPLALPVPDTLAPGEYSLEIIIYSQADGAPLAPSSPSALDGQRLPLGRVQVLPAP